MVAVSFVLTACTAAKSVPPETARQQLERVWRSNQHAIWEIDWPNAPTGGLVTAEIWQAGDSYRYEILEASAPALLGEMLVFNGTQSWRYNRLSASQLPESTIPTLAPVTDAVILISNLLSRPPRQATVQADTINFASVTKIVVQYANGDTLAMWIDEQSTGLPLRVEFTAGEQHGRLTTRFSEPLLDPPPALFTADDWLH